MSAKINMSAGIAHAALVKEVAQRDGALERYQALRERYELASLARTRRQLLMASHVETLSHLRSLVAAVAEMQSSAERDDATVEPPVPETLLAAVRLLTSSTLCGYELQESLQAILSCGAAFQVLQAEALAATTSPAERPCAQHLIQGEPLSIQKRVSAKQAYQLKPLLHWCSAGLPYQQRLLEPRRHIASELARVRRYTVLISADPSQNSGFAEATTQTALKDAREGLRRAKNSQRCVKRRLYELHQRLTTAGWDECTTADDDLDPEAATQTLAQIRKELQRGRVTLLRILCDEDGFSNH